MFARLLIANRGEIACRVIRTARRLGIRTVAVYSDADAGAMHVALADEAVRIGPASARESYLDAHAILRAARSSGAQAIHPGYGFLSESADFAAACLAAGIAFVGPPERAIRAMGSKIAAKRLMEAAGVPLVPGYHGDAQDDATLREAAARIGYPVLIKASAGGGGKGMRIVQSHSELPAALESARREARAAFADDRLLLERCLIEPRHIEIQVFADNQGGCIHLHERDCSIQRRHQKILEEAPAPGLSAEQRAVMGAAAIRAARSVGYAGAGTVEFIVTGAEFFFIEMNTRLQVEHPVTEMITGIDLVEWQLRIAAGEALPLAQEDVPLQGCAIEARLYAEDPERDFLPSTGRLWHVRWPAAEEGTRVDAGIRAGDDVSVHYDPMLAKLIVWSETRADAVTRLREALEQCAIGGVSTNLALLHAIASQPDFAAGKVHTGFIPKHEPDLLPGVAAGEHLRLISLAATGLLLHGQRGARDGLAASPWSAADGWRLNAPPVVRMEFWHRETLVSLQIQPLPGGASVQIDGESIAVEAATLDEERISARIGGTRYSAGWRLHADQVHLFVRGRHLVLARAERRTRNGAAEHGGLKSPMPGQVIQVLVAPGAQVKRGQALMIVEAMKMEHTIVAPSDGIVEAVAFAAGDRVEEGVQLLRVKPASGS